MSWVCYVALLVALVVRVRATPAAAHEPILPRRGEPLWLTRVHHRLFALLLLGPPLERLLLGGVPGGQRLGVGLFAAGVVLYRLAGRTLGDALSPFTEPRERARLVTEGPYAVVRHPMYVSEALIAVGAPLALGSRYVLWAAVPALLVLLVRMVREDEALARTFPEYPRYAARTKRVIPFFY